MGKAEYNKNLNFEKQLSQVLHRPSAVMADKSNLEETFSLAGMELERKWMRERISFARFLYMQMKFIGWRIWGAQGIFLLLIRGMFCRINEYVTNPLYLTKLLFCLSVLVFIAAIPFVCRPARYRMQEVEAASRFSSVKLLMAKLIFIGIGDLFILAGIFFIAILKTSLQPGSIILYLCFPFLLAGSGCLFMLGRLSTRQFFIGSMGFCSFLILAFPSLPGHYTFLFCQSLSGRWMIICALLTVFCIHQFRYIIRHAAYTEMQVA